MKKPLILKQHEVTTYSKTTNELFLLLLLILPIDTFHSVIIFFCRSQKV